MKKNIVIFLLLTFVTLFSFVNRDSDFDTMVGIFVHTEKDHIISLNLKSDSTFSLSHSYPGFCSMTRRNCNGKWKLINSNQIEISCISSTQLDAISVGYIQKRIDTVFIKNNNKVYIGKDKLKRKTKK